MSRLANDGRADDYAKSLFNVAVGRSVRVLREAAGLSRKSLGDAAKLTTTTLAAIESGAMACPLYAAASIAEAIDCTLDDIVPVMIDEPEES